MVFRTRLIWFRHHIDWPKFLHALPNYVKTIILRFNQRLSRLLLYKLATLGPFVFPVVWNLGWNAFVNPILRYRFLRSIWDTLHDTSIAGRRPKRYVFVFTPKLKLFFYPKCSLLLHLSLKSSTVLHCCLAAMIEKSLSGRPSTIGVMVRGSPRAWDELLTVLIL